jgi:glycosyltransferase involved in cell wall biosynthesis
VKPSVSILLPIHNAQDRLENQVAVILDVLTELTSRFEVLIIDDGSSDDSFEVARHLSLVYPQVTAMRHPLRLGLAQAVNSGLERTGGDLVLVGDERHGVRADDLRRLWHSYAEQSASELLAEEVGGSRMSAGHSRWFEKMLAWKPNRRQSATSSRAIDRQEWTEKQQADEIVRGIKRRVDDRENGTTRRPAAQSPERGSKSLGPIDRRRHS